MVGHRDDLHDAERDRDVGGDFCDGGSVIKKHWVICDIYHMKCGAFSQADKFPKSIG